MKIFKRILAAALACAMALCVLTACGDSGASSSEIAAKVIAGLEENGMYGVTTSDDLTAAATSYATAYAPAIQALNSAEVRAYNNAESSDDYYEALEKAQNNYEKAMASSLSMIEDCNATYQRGSASASQSYDDAVDSVVKKIISDAQTEGKTIKDIGCKSFSAYASSTTTLSKFVVVVYRYND